MESLKELGEPKEFWEYFYEISKYLGVHSTRRKLENLF